MIAGDVRRPRVVVVGAGLNGLVAAVRLALARCDVTVVEAAPVPGGAVRTEPGPLPGFIHDPCAGFFPLTLASPAFAGLGVRERVDWVSPPVAMAPPFLDGTAIGLHRDLDATVASLDAVAPGAGPAWRTAVVPLLRRREALFRAALGPFPPLLAGPRPAARRWRGRDSQPPCAATSSRSAGACSRRRRRWGPSCSARRGPPPGSPARSCTAISPRARPVAADSPSSWRCSRTPSAGRSRAAARAG